MTDTGDARIGILHQYLIATTSCNLRCAYCWYTTGALPMHPGVLSPLDLGRWLKECSGSKQLITLTITGGEPLLHPALGELLAIGAGHGAKLALLTNGTLLTANLAALLREFETEVHVSLDSVNPRYHESLRGYHKQVMRALDLLESAGIQRRAITVAVSRGNLPEIPLLIRFAADHGFGISFHPLALPKDSPLSLTNCWPLEKESIREWLRKWAEETGRIGSYRLMMWYIDHGSLPSLNTCPFALTSLVLDADGSMYSCFQRRDVPLGHLARATAGEVLDRKIRELTNGQFGKCVAVDCMGVL